MRHLFLTLVTAAVLLPIVWIFMFAFKTEGDGISGVIKAVDNGEGDGENDY